MPRPADHSALPLAAIRTLNRERAVTVMITSHDMPDLEHLRARIVLLNGGEIAYDGSFDALRPLARQCSPSMSRHSGPPYSKLARRSRRSVAPSKPIESYVASPGYR